MNEETLFSILISIEAALNSRPITQGETGDVSNTFFVGKRLNAVPRGLEPRARKDVKIIQSSTEADGRVLEE